MTFVAASDGDELSIVLSPRMTNVYFTVVEPRAISVRKVQSRRKGESLVWTLSTSERLHAGAQVVVAFRYDGAGETANQYHIGPEVSFASAWGTNWYPLLATDDDKGSGRLRIHVPPGHDALATGTRIADERGEKERVVTYDVPHPTYFAFAAGAFHVQTVAGKTPAKSYLLNERPNARKWLEGVGAIVAALEKEFGPYPYRELIFVEVPRPLATAASFNAAGLPGLILLNHRAFDVPDVAMLWEFLAHEIAHEWFPHALSFDRPGGRYMEEALVEYGALAVVETLAGAEVAKEFRISGYHYDPMFSAAKYFSNVDRGIDHPIGALQSLPGHRELAYTKGFLFFHMLARKVGIERFRTAIRDIEAAHPYQSVPWWSFLAELEERTGAGLASFYDQWLNRTGVPSWSSAWRNVEGGVEVTLRQTLPAYVLDLPLRVTLDGGRTVEATMHVDAEETSAFIATPAPATKVDVDPDFHVLHRIAPPAS